MTRRIQRSDDDTMTDFETNKVLRQKMTDNVDEISIIMFNKCITFNLISELIIVLLYFFSHNDLDAKQSYLMKRSWSISALYIISTTFL